MFIFSRIGRQYFIITSIDLEAEPTDEKQISIFEVLANPDVLNKVMQK
jgi:hypothetical protein